MLAGTAWQVNVPDTRRGFVPYTETETVPLPPMVVHCWTTPCGLVRLKVMEEEPLALPSGKDIGELSIPAKTTDIFAPGEEYEKDNTLG